MKNDIYCYLIADIMTKVFRKCLLSGRLPNIFFCQNPSISLVVMATERLNLRKIFKKSTPQKL